MDFEEDIAKELAKDIYVDGAQESIQATGKTLGLIPRAIKAALSPLEKWILQKEYNIEATKRMLEKKLENIPPENISSPEPYVAVPAMQYISYCVNNDELRDMYANLLANSMINIVKKGVHPGFVDIIKQLSPDEARILKYMIEGHEAIPIINVRYQNEHGEGIDVLKNFSDIGEKSGCESTIETEAAFDNLIRLGLISQREWVSLTNKKLYESLKTHERIKEYNDIKELIDKGYNKIVYNEGFVSLSSFGKSFCNICIIPPINTKITQ